MAFELKEEGFKLKDVLRVVHIPESTYHYQIDRLSEEDPDRTLKEEIIKLFEKHEGRYDHRRIHLALRNQGYVINHKKVQRIMGDLGLKCVKFQRKSRYNSYKGNVGRVAKNRLNHRFDRLIPLQKIVTDMTEFKCLNKEKLYLNPFLDLYNGEIISFSISNRSTLDLVLNPLNDAVEIINSEAKY